MRNQVIASRKMLLRRRWFYRAVVSSLAISSAAGFLPVLRAQDGTTVKSGPLPPVEIRMHPQATTAPTHGTNLTQPSSGRTTITLPAVNQPARSTQGASKKTGTVAVKMNSATSPEPMVLPKPQNSSSGTKIKMVPAVVSAPTTSQGVKGLPASFPKTIDVSSKSELPTLSSVPSLPSLSLPPIPQDIAVASPEFLTGTSHKNLADGRSTRSANEEEAVAADVASESHVAQSSPVAKGPVKFSLDDEGVVDHGPQNTPQGVLSSSRAPELVKPKKYTVSQSVTLAHAAEMTIDEGTEPAPLVSTKEPAPLEPSESKGNELKGVQPLDPATPSLLPLAKPNRGSRSSDPATPSIQTMPSPSDISLPRETVREIEQKSAVDTRKPESKSGEKDYEIESFGTYSIDTPFIVEKVFSMDAEVCSVFNTGRSITIVGGKTGETEVVVQSIGKERRSVYVKVMEPGKLHGTQKNDLEKVKQMIGHLVPDAKLVFITKESGAIEIRGTTESEASARRVLELVRKVCLVPIEDKVRVLP